MALVDKNGNSIKSGNGNAVKSAYVNRNSGRAGNGGVGSAAANVSNRVRAAAAAAPGANGPPGANYGGKQATPPLASVGVGSSDGLKDSISKGVSSLSEYLVKSPLVETLDNTVGKWFGGHEGQTYGQSTMPPPGTPAYDERMKEGAPWYDQFTYQMTDDERNSQLDHAFIDGNPTTDRQRAIAKATGGRAPTSGNQVFYNPDGTLNAAKTAHAVNSQQRGEGSGNGSIVPPPVSGGGSSNGGYFPGGGGNNGSVNRTGYADNYFQAIPDSVFNSVISEDGITSPRLKPVPISYGNSYNAGRRWKSGVFGQQ